MRRVENWFSSAENMIGRSRNWKRNSTKNSFRQRGNSDGKPPKKTNVTKLMKSAASWRPRQDEAYAKFSEKVTRRTAGLMRSVIR
jgi:hypothetical protein